MQILKRGSSLVIERCRRLAKSIEKQELTRLNNAIRFNRIKNESRADVQASPELW